MPYSTKSFLDLKSFSTDDLNSFFLNVAELKKTSNRSKKYLGKTLALLFFEASTRTRLSFETAAHRLGYGPIYLDAGAKSSLEKGETIEDSILNVAAMEPDILVIRCGDELNLRDISEKVSSRVVNAGWGMRGHPSQGLLDFYTMFENFKDLNRSTLAGKKVLYVGDIKHSRVMASHFEILDKLNIDWALCAPNELLPNNLNFKKIDELEKGLEWADIVYTLRCQFERHTSLPFSKDEFRKSYGLNLQKLKYLKQDSIFMHPGPINHGIEIESEVLSDRRNAILKQVNNGIYVREIILKNLSDSSEQ